MNNEWSVYKHTSPSGKVYIGIAKDVKHRWRGNGAGYKGSTRFANAIKKYGWDNFKHEILFSNLSKEKACEKEVELIKEYRSTETQYGYNLLSGGECGLHSKETKDKLRKAAMGHTVSKDIKVFLSELKSIPIICIETKQIYKNCKEAGKELGICMTSISKVCLGKASHAGGLHFAKLSDYKTNNLPVFKNSTNKNKKIICISTGEVFESETQAAKKYGVTSQAISHACTGKVKTCCGLVWMELMDIPARLEQKNESKD